MVVFRDLVQVSDLYWFDAAPNIAVKLEVDRSAV